MRTGMRYVGRLKASLNIYVSYIKQKRAQIHVCAYNVSEFMFYEFRAYSRKNFGLSLYTEF